MMIVMGQLYMGHRAAKFSGIAAAQAKSDTVGLSRSSRLH
jgi:hypothetical protein